MRDLQDCCGGWVAEPWETPDPDDVDDSLEALMLIRRGSAVDAFWHHLIDVNPEERMKLRRHQIMVLARYARAPLLGWDDQDVQDLRSWYEELSELMGAESDAGRLIEDR